jgi:hypothetical protein
MDRFWPMGLITRNSQYSSIQFEGWYLHKSYLVSHVLATLSSSGDQFIRTFLPLLSFQGQTRHFRSRISRNFKHITDIISLPHHLDTVISISPGIAQRSVIVIVIVIDAISMSDTLAGMKHANISNENFMLLIDLQPQKPSMNAQSICAIIVKNRIGNPIIQSQNDQIVVQVRLRIPFVLRASGGGRSYDHHYTQFLNHWRLLDDKFGLE